MKLYDCFAEKNYHTSVATTFGIDFDAYESIALPRLRGAGCCNNMVIADSRMLTQALSGASALPRHAGRLYAVDGVSARGVFHPKVFLQLGRRGGRLLVGSANLTSSGLAGNLELVGTVTCDENDTGEQRLIALAWQYVSGLIDPEHGGLAAQRDWMLARTPWLRRATRASGPVELSDRTAAALLTTGDATGIGQRFADLINGTVSRLFVITPYWDAKLEALASLVGRLGSQRTDILIDPATVVFPTDALSRIPNARLYGRGDFQKGRFIHAKAVIAQTAEADHVLLGSANCTVSALGVDGIAGNNEEVCLYRRFPPNSLLRALDLIDLFAPERVLDSASLKVRSVEEDLPLDELAAKTPGHFECRVDVLTWLPANNVDPEACKVDLLAEGGQPIPCTISRLGNDGGKVRYQISGTNERPAFARVVSADGLRSAPAVVTLIDRLGAAIRENRSRKAENAIRDLEGETEASLMLLEVLDVLEQLETDDGVVKAPTSVPETEKVQDEKSDSAQFQKLTYEQFIAGRRARTDQSNVAHNSLATSDVSTVRSFLNRILGMAVDDHDIEDDDASLLNRAFDLGDETDDDGRSIAKGGEFDRKPKKPLDETDQSEQERRRKTLQRKATKAQIVAAVDAFGKRVRDRMKGGLLDNRDVLRLRALLMVVCTASWFEKGNKQTNPPSSVQVLPAEGEAESWPLIMGRLLFAIFGGSSPAIRQLYLSNVHDQIPSDIIECWATCYWCLQACLNAPVSVQEHARIKKLLGQVAQCTYRLTLPTKMELVGADVSKLMDRMSAQYAGRLGVSREAIANGHKAFVAEVFRQGG